MLWRLAKILGLEPHELLATATRWESRPEPSPSTIDAARRVSANTRARMQRSRAARFLPDASVASPGPARSWFHADDAAPMAAAAPPDDLESATSGQTGPPAATPVDGAGPTGGTSLPRDPDLPTVLGWVNDALADVPDERAELALMLALDERRIRRIVREELDRRT